MSKLRSGLSNDRRRYRCYCTPHNIDIVIGPGSIYNQTLTEIVIPGNLYESAFPNNNSLEDGDVPIPMSNIVFNFFGINCSNNMYWSSNNALIFGTPIPNLELNITRNLVPAILLGNYDRKLKTFFYKNILKEQYSITILRFNFYDYYTDLDNSTTYEYQIRLIKENTGLQRQFVEIYIISSPPSPGYSTANITYPSGTNQFGQPIDSNGNIIDSTKLSPYNITNGTTFLNPCGTTFSTASPSINTSFVFASNSSGSVWTFTNNSHVNI